MYRAVAFVIALALMQYAASAQSASAPRSAPLSAPTPVRATSAAEAAGLRARGAFEQVDPDSPEAQGEAAAIYAGLPPLAPEPGDADADTAIDEAPPPRGPAVRMIPREVVQPLPAAPAPAKAQPVAPAPATRSQGFVVRSILPVEGTFRYGDWYWDESAAPASGQLVITVDLNARVISAFRDGHEIGTAVVLVGTQQHPTPLGTFPILTKERDNVSEKYNNAPMPWTLRLTWDGIAIHGSPVMNGYASHGCIGIPDEFAAKLFDAAKRGDKVIITRGKMIGIGDRVL
jgi:lipoprotein-anchoring transpeptidase ErfK/SrfK